MAQTAHCIDYGVAQLVAADYICWWQKGGYPQSGFARSHVRLEFRDGESGVNHGDMVRQFLLKPADRSAFNRFFGYSLRLATGYFRSLRAKGYVLPTDDRTDSDPIRDLAIDTLGWLMQGSQDRPFYLIRDYFGSLDIGDLNTVEGEVLEKYYRILVYRHCKQQASRLAGERDPQIGALKRRFKEVLSEPEFMRSYEAGSHGVFLASHAGCLTDDKPEIDDISLLRLVAETFLHSRTRREWCHAILQGLSQFPEYSNRLSEHRLIAVVVRVNAEFAQLYSQLPSSSGLPPDVMKVAEVGAVVERVMDIVNRGTLERFTASGRLTTREAQALLKALELYLGDLTNGGEADPIPVYFRETMPAETHSRYLQDYKYILETMVKEAVNRLRAELS